MIRFGFSIRTKSGQRVDSIQIVAASQDDAERRLRQMYRQCVILGHREQAVTHGARARRDASANGPIGELPSVRTAGVR